MTFKKGHKHSLETKQKIGLSNRGEWIEFECYNCGITSEEKQSHYKKKKRHFCCMKCYQYKQVGLKDGLAKSVGI